jgi:multidrug efflux pump subunit AcrA (membrane-fusion protein)
MKRLERLRLRIVSPAGMAIVLVVLALAAVVGVRRSLSSPSPREALYTVVEGPLTISVTESGTIQSRDKVIVRSAVEGRNTILFIIPEGRIVQPGDLLVNSIPAPFRSGWPNKRSRWKIPPPR